MLIALTQKIKTQCIENANCFIRNRLAVLFHSVDLQLRFFGDQLKKSDLKNFYSISLQLNDHGIAYLNKYSAVLLENLA
jgi:hypothetical protein